MSVRIIHLSLSAAKGFPILAPTILYSLKLQNQSSLICRKTFFSFLFHMWQSMSYITDWITKNKLNNFQESEPTGRLSVKESCLQYI